ncbi:MULTISPECIES: GNAT family N-acetyltransferase [unclassified Streptomyces]|uniref:GNAT family N-acetyltransferase n=1 Tax=unclassified Streptomyces TaxID=2593676 RepID=UPI000A52C970|nr:MULTISPECIES: GNAT family N-acetyltransferase [unclassified Streptomyces]MCX5147550.1 GNAT family N-acetyltransferase [Streptomyces sp. NBC_00320]WSN50667.1 GNAT family N-acetyltransferase [Streptomyces sp. NBC_01296]WSW59886.1 GNAT family N-acetyltransferase [Streptomyces sp. NBC_00998]
MICYGQAVLDLADELVDAYADVFSAPPWNEDEETIRQFAVRLQADARRRGFRTALAQSTAGIDGFATGWLTPASFPKARGYTQVAAQLGPERVRELLTGALEIGELAVRPYARGHGTGRALLTEITADAPDRRAWLLTSRLATDTVATYRRLGWHEVTARPGTQTGVIVFLSPDHPGR